MRPIILVVLIAVALFVAATGSVSPPLATRIGSAAAAPGRSAPSLSVRCFVGGGMGESYDFSADPDGSATLRVWPLLSSPRPVRRLQISRAQMAELDHEIDEQRFFELRSEYGSIVPDAGDSVLEIMRDGQFKRLTLHYIEAVDKNSAEVRHATTVWNLVRTWYAPYFDQSHL